MSAGCSGTRSRLRAWGACSVSSHRPFGPDAQDELPLAHPRAPGLADHDPIARGLHGPRGFVDPVEVVQPSDEIAAADTRPADEDLLVMPVERRGDITVEID